MPLPAHPCPSLLSATPTLSSVSSPHCLYIPRPIIFHTSRPSAMPWSCMVLADLKQRYGHLNTRPRTAIAACKVTWQSSGPEVIASPLAWPRPDSRPSPAVPWPTAIAFRPRHWPSPGPDPADPPPSPPRARDRLRGSL